MAKQNRAMTDLPNHLTENAQRALLLSDGERINKVRHTRWIAYTKAQQILKKLEDLLSHPKTHRMPNLLIVGDTNNGKTMIVNRFKSLHPPCDNEEGEAISYPVLIVQAPPVPDEGRFYDAILDEVFAPYKENDRPGKKQFQVFRILEQIGTKMLIIDEIHDILAGTPSKQQQFLNVIKALGNKLQIPIVGVGIDQAFTVFQTDTQLANRFEPIFLTKWRIEPKSEENKFQSLLGNFEKTLPLWKPSMLIKQELTLELYTMSEGLIGELSTILTKACVEAIKNRTECITLEILKSIDWTQPSKRKQEIQQSA